MATTITITDEVKRRFERYRHDGLANDAEVLEAMMNVVPDHEEIANGCTQCGNSPDGPGPVDEVGGIVNWFTFEPPNGGEPRTVSAWFCSPECLSRAQEDIDLYVPDNPDLVVVGGHRMPRAQVASGTHYHVDDQIAEVRIDVPGAFDGEGVGGEYDYAGEPVYIQNKGRWVDSAVVYDIVHEEAHTVLILESDTTVERMCHPDQQMREPGAEPTA